MCTAVTLSAGDFFFGRNLDYEQRYGETLLFIPRHFRPPNGCFPLGEGRALLGIGCFREGYPLFFDGMNERGLCMAGLRFAGFADYAEKAEKGEAVPSFALIPFVLRQCDSVREAVALLRTITVTDEAFSADLPAAPLHWLLADRARCVTVEVMHRRLYLYDNPAGVLTNAPPFPQQLFALNNFRGLSPAEPENLFAPRLPLRRYSRGMGAIGLPGDFSSQSRFVRAAFLRAHSPAPNSAGEGVHQLMHILDAVAQPKGCCQLPDGSLEYTQYSAVCHAARATYYLSTYDNRGLRAVSMPADGLEGTEAVLYSFDTAPRVQRLRGHSPRS